MAKEVIVDALDERLAVRKIYKSAHCRPQKIGNGYRVFYTDKAKKEHTIATSTVNRADAWRNAAKVIGQKVVDKLEQ